MTAKLVALLLASLVAVVSATISVVGACSLATSMSQPDAGSKAIAAETAAATWTT